MAIKQLMRIFVLAALLLFVAAGVSAQNQDSRLFITDADASSVPVITLRMYGLSSDGQPLDLTQRSLLIFHNGEPVESVEIGRQVDVGTLTVFVVDVTDGAAGQIPAIEEAIEQFASPQYMREQVDYVAIYQVGETTADQLLEPAGFYNSVLNFFATTPLEAQEGATALIDSTVGLLNDLSSLAPNGDMPASIVLFTDGTDAVSTAYSPEDVGRRGAELGIPVHTVWLENEALTVGQEAGRNYLAQVASTSRGVAARLDQPETVTPIFERIAALRTQRLVHYRIPEPTGGDATVTVTLPDEPSAQAETTVTINEGTPIVALTLPADSRTISVPSLDTPVRLAFSGAVSWLDGVERSVQNATLLVNGQPIADVPADALQRFEVEIPNFAYGANSIRLSVTDDQGLRGQSPDLSLNVVEGQREIPEALQPAGLVLPPALPICFAGLLLLAAFGLGGMYAYRSGRLSRFGRGRRRDEREAPVVAAGPDLARVPVEMAADASGPGAGYLEVLEAETAMPAHIPLKEEETRLGRSPALADVAFEQDITVSRLHATIIWDGHAFRLYDDDSTSGTWVNDQEVPDYGAPLFDGDEIFMGKVHLRFHQN